MGNERRLFVLTIANSEDGGTNVTHESNNITLNPYPELDFLKENNYLYLCISTSCKIKR